MMGLAAVMSRIAQLDSMIKAVDPAWTSTVWTSNVSGSSASSQSFQSALDDASASSTASGDLQVLPQSLAQLRGQYPTPPTASATASANASASYGSEPKGATSADDTGYVNGWRIVRGDWVDSVGNGLNGETAWKLSDQSLADFDKVSKNIPFAAEIRAAAVHWKIAPLLLAALASTESSFHPNAVSRCGAMGLTQLMPRTAKGLGVTDPFDPAQNLDGGAHYIWYQLNRFGRADLAFGAYNAGPGCVSRIHGVPDSKIHYVKTILNKWQSYLGMA